MAAKKKEVWDQQKSEPAAAYARFLIYRNLGPSRSLDLAYAAFGKVTKGDKKRVPGSWQQESVRWNWQERASAWDIAMLSQLGQEAIVAFAAFLGDLTRRALAALADPNMQPRNWEALLHTAEIINALIAPQALEALARQHGVPDPSPGGKPSGPVAGRIGP